MRSKEKLLWIVLMGVMLASAVWTWWPLGDASERLQDFQLRGLLYDSRDVPLTETEQDIFGAATVVKRLVRVENRTLLVTVIDGSGNRHAVHDPLFCLRGTGWSVADYWVVPLETGEAKRVKMEMKDRRAEVMYWFTDGQQAHASVLRYWVQTTLRRVMFGASGPEPVLVIIATIDGEPIDWNRALLSVPVLLDL